MDSLAELAFRVAEPPVYRREGDGLKGLESEWVLANGIGGFAMGTIAGVPTRRYHGLLIGAMRPPVERVAAVNAIAECVVLGEGEDEELVHLTPFHFAASEDRPDESPYLVSFERDLGCRWRWVLPDGTEVLKRLWLYRQRNAAGVRYELRAGKRAARLILRPLVSLRDFHGLVEPDPTRAGEYNDAEKQSEPRFSVRKAEEGLIVATREAGLLLGADAEWEIDEQWWEGVHYEREHRRGMAHVESLFSPGFVAIGAGSVTLRASLDTVDPGAMGDDEARERRRVGMLIGRALGRLRDAPPDQAEQQKVARLAAASDLFVVSRRVDGREGESVIAGYPWFADWGRDTMISLPGLLIETGRGEEAGRVLETFARNRRNGIIPNRFDDHAGDAHYNTVDASLWFIHACCAYLNATGDRELFNGVLRSACLDVVSAYREGTDFGIGVDPSDGLVKAGNPETQLTWMDAKRDGVTFTPRHGKPVEINALWHHGLVSLSRAMHSSEPAKADHLFDLADQAAVSFREKLWNHQLGCCYDCLTPETRTRWKPAREVRPNQVFAASLRHSPLDEAHRGSLIAVVRARLLTPMGLRTLDPAAPGYEGRFQGTMFERDRAYHNGTVWPWLMGPFAEGLMRAGRFSEASRAEARRVLGPLVAYADGRYPGTLPEVFDGDHSERRPQRPGGCIAQAWSVAETLRVYLLALRGG